MYNYDINIILYRMSNVFTKLKDNKAVWLATGAVAAYLVTYYGFNLESANTSDHSLNSNVIARPSQFRQIELEGEYKAVFLSNGQTYFGKMNDINEEFIELTDIYYLRLSGDLHNQKPDGNKNSLPEQLILIKLGKELHGPNDKMAINKNEIIFIEGLKANSMVVQAIYDYRNKNNLQ